MYKHNNILTVKNILKEYFIAAKMEATHVI